MFQTWRDLEPSVRRALLDNYQFAITPSMKVAAETAGEGVWRQFVPALAELQFSANEHEDPIGDTPHSPLPFLVHRYPNRVLWKVTPNCAVYCRFCFRKEHIGRKGEHLSSTDIAAAQAYLRTNPQIEEVILSGGDPMTLSTLRLRECLAPLAEISSISRIRVHSRLPVVAPNMVSDDWLEALNSAGKSIAIVLHVNHPGEFSAESDRLLAHLAARYLLFSQTVLLKGVNDDPEILHTLMNAFLQRHIHPYYLHHLDPARGTGHFRLSLAQGRVIYQDLRRRISGIALPRYVVEMPGGGGKVAVLELSEDQYRQLKEAGID